MSKARDLSLAAKAPIASPVFTGNLGVGVTPESWLSTYPAVQIGAAGCVIGSNDNSFVSLNGNAYVDSVNSRWEYVNSDYASQYQQYDGQHNWRVAASGSADAAISWNDAMTINNAGIVTKPLQPMVSMSRSDSALSIGSGVNLFATTSITTWVLQGITHNTSNGRFTLPVTGKYRVSFYSIKEAGVQAYFDLKKNGNLYGMRIYMNTNTSVGWSQYSGTGVYSYSANDYLTVVCNQGGTNNAHGGEHMNFSIELIG